MSLLAVDKLSIHYGNEVAVNELSFTVEAGESVGLVGESGSGKTQAALAMLGLLPGSADVTGRILLAGVDVVGANDRTLDALRATRAAMVFQDPSAALNPYLRVGEQLRQIILQHRLAAGADDALHLPQKQSGADPADQAAKSINLDQKPIGADA